MNNDKNSYFNTIKQNRIKGFRKSFDKLREKLKSLKGNSLIEENTKETETLNDPFYTEDSKIDLPKIKLNINNVFSRLYHNVVLLQNEKNIIPHKRNNSAQILHKNNTTNNINVNNNNHHIPPNPKIKYKLKNVLKSTNGKEFTIKITDEVIKKCLTKYSGGPSVISYLKSQLKKDQFNEKENELREDQVNFYNLITKEGNSVLHIATMENLPELVKYFTDKGANVNIQNLNGDTPLHISAREHFDACTLILLKAKASLDIPNNNNKIPFDYFNEDRKKKFGLDKIVIKDNNGKIKN